MLKLPLALLTLSSLSFASQTAPQTRSLSLTPESFNQTVTFNRFDPSLGTLTGIEFTLSANTHGTATINPGTNPNGSYSYTSQSDVFLSDVLSNFFYNEVLPVAATQSSNYSGAQSQFTLTASASASALAIYHGTGAGPFSLSSYTGNGSVSDPIDSTPFVGVGTLNLLLTANDTSTCTATGSCTVTNSASTNLQLVYDYNPAVTTVPEPATLGMISFALAALGIAKARASSRYNL